MGISRVAALAGQIIMPLPACSPLTYSKAGTTNKDVSRDISECAEIVTACNVLIAARLLRWLNAILALRTSNCWTEGAELLSRGSRPTGDWRLEEPREEARPMGVLAIGNKTAILVPQ